ncbi:hypothetical protein HMN09_00833700 [Mycena chlorophos]|uniref:DUF6534 domain-containing protein n=1 Tax=Mycena chlorophos TaxID=658473 RepID=A0A8H6W3J1_MYCCL|nr:hypothetical protein HMN09_00833700 [Mycena chlorophos]
MPGLDLNTTIGPLVIGAFICCTFLGVITLQLAHYVKNYYEEDRLYVRSAVIVLYIVQLGFTICICQSAYVLGVTDFGETLELLYSPWGLNVAQVLGRVSLSCRALLTYQIYRATGALYLCISLWTITALVEALALVLCVDFFRTRSIAISISNPPYNRLLLLLFLSDAAMDLVNASVLCYHLWRKRRLAFSGNTTTMVDRLLVYTLQTGLATSMVSLAAGLAVHIWVMFFIGMPCSFTSAFIANINNRGSLRLSHTGKKGTSRSMTRSGDSGTWTERRGKGSTGRPSQRMQIQISRSVLQSTGQPESPSRSRSDKVLHLQSVGDADHIMSIEETKREDNELEMEMHPLPFEKRPPMQHPYAS